MSPLALATLVAALLGILFVAGCGSSAGAGAAGGTADAPIDASLPAINLTAPGLTGAGEVPTFEWEAVSGAARYRLVVLNGSGAPLWAWNGTETRVNLGGLPGDRPEGVSGPVIDTGSSWSVAAFDANGKTLATSAIRSVSP